jgi:hypothetical protein
MAKIQLLTARSDSRPAQSRGSLGQRGQVVILVGLALPVLLGFVGLALDVGLMMVYRTHEQRAADAAALAGAYVLLNEGFNVTAQTSAKTGPIGAYEYAAKNGYSGAVNSCTLPAGGVCVNIPPGPATAAAYRTDHFVEVIVTRQRPTIFMRILGIGDTRVAARAVAGVNDVTKPYALMVLNPTKCNAYEHSGSANMTINKGGAIVNSSATTGSNSCLGTSAVQDGTSVLLAQNCQNKLGASISCPIDYYNHGRWQCGSNATCTPAPTRVGARLPDPLAGIPRPIPCKTVLNDPPGCNVPLSPDSGGTWNSTSQKSVSGSSEVTLRPGVYYGGIKITGNPAITFEAGTYIMAGGGANQGGFSCCSTGVKLKGDGVTFVNMHNPYGSGNSAACGSFSMTGSGSLVELKAPPDNHPPGMIGPIDDNNAADGVQVMLFWQHDDCTQDFTYGGSGWSVTGVFYIPTAHFKFTGGGAMGSVQIIVDTYKFAGSASTTINYHNFVDPNPPKVSLIE